MNAEAPVPPAVGVQVLIVFLALLAGLAGGTLLAGFSPLGTVLVAAPLCVFLFLFARVFADSSGSATGYLVLLALWVFLFAWLLAGIGELARPRRVNRNVLGALALVSRLLVVLALALFVPTASLVAGFRRASGSTALDTAAPRGPLAAVWIHILLGAAAFGAGATLLALAALVRDPTWRVAALVSLAVVGPIAIGTTWTYAYGWLLSRWATPTPAPVDDALRELRARTGFSFGRVLCLEPAYGFGRVCAVLSVPRRPTLLLSANLAESLSPPQLLAVLSHEAAHVRRRHTARKLAWGVCLACAMVASAAVLAWAVTPLFPRRFGATANFLVVFPVLLSRGLYDAMVTRRHEAEADQFAVETVSAEALLGALEAIQGEPPSAGAVHNRWTTHSTWAVRSARIRAFEERREYR